MNQYLVYALISLATVVVVNRVTPLTNIVLSRA